MLQQLNEGVKERLTWASVNITVTLLLLLFHHPVISCFFAGMAGGQMDSIFREIRAEIRAEKIIRGYHERSKERV